MTHKQGTHLGGIRTLADLKCRCNIDGDCWLWTGGLSHGKPSLWFMSHSGRYAMRSGRRVAVVLSGVPMEPGQVVWQAPKCFEHLCVNPAHAVFGTRSEALLEHERRDGWRKVLVYAKAAARILAVVAKVNPEQVIEIRNSNETRKAISEKYGISRSQVDNILNGKAWRGSAAAKNNSVFSWRGAA